MYESTLILKNEILKMMKRNMKIVTPLVDEQIAKFKVGDLVKISGCLYTARDSAHKKIFELIKEGKKLLIKLKGQIIFYAGPTSAKPSYPCGSIGPTSGYRMDPYTPSLLEHGLKGMNGKGTRSKEIIESIKKNKVIYFVVVGGAAALIGRSVKKCKEIVYPELLGETIYRLYVNNFEAMVAIDTYGNNLFESESRKYSRLPSN